MKKLALLIALLLIPCRSWATDYCADADLCYKFSEGSGSTVADSSGNSRTGDFWEVSQWSSDVPTEKTGYSTYFDSANDYVRNSTGVFDAPTTLSIVLWGKVSNPQPGSFAGRIFTERNSYGPIFSTGTNNIIRFFWVGSGTNLNRVSQNNAITIDTWEHYSVTWDGSGAAANVTIYINATPLASYATTTNGTSLSNADGSTQFGREADSTTQVYMRQTDVGIFSSQLTSTDISAIYDSGIDGSWSSGPSIHTTILRNAVIRNAVIR